MHSTRPPRRLGSRPWRRIAAFAAATRGAWRAGGVNDGLTGMLVPGAPASYAVWETGDLDVSAPADAPGASVAPL